MMIRKIIFPNTHWFLLILIPSIAIGFYPRYFAKPFDSINALVHAHFIVMALWAVLSITQPFLIYRKKFEFHKKLGRTSYWLMPLVIASTYLVLRTGYESSMTRLHERVASGKSSYTAEQIKTMSSDWIGQSIDDLFILIILYALAIIYRKKVLHHATFMLGATLTMAGPALGRAIPYVEHLLEFSAGWFGSVGAEAMVVSFFLALGFYQKRNGQTIKPALITAAMFSISILFMMIPYSTIPYWSDFVEYFLLKT